MAKCHEAQMRLNALRFEAHWRLADWTAALADVNQFVYWPHQPGEWLGHQDIWATRGQLYEHLGRVDEAMADYRQSHDAELELSALLEKLGRPCEALTPLESRLGLHPRERTLPMVAAPLARLTAACPHYYGQGHVVIHDHDHESVKVGDARVLAHIMRRFPFTLVTQGLANRLGLPSNGPEVWVDGQTGTLVRLARLQLGDAVATDVEAVVLPFSPHHGTVVTLGQSFFARFRVNEDIIADERGDPGEELSVEARGAVTPAR
jgi:hypothetical protein